MAVAVTHREQDVRLVALGRDTAAYSGFTGELVAVDRGKFKDVHFDANGWCYLLPANDSGLEPEYVKFTTNIFECNGAKYMREGDNPPRWLRDVKKEGKYHFPAAVVEGRAVKMVSKVLTIAMDEMPVWHELNPIQDWHSNAEWICCHVFRLIGSV